MTLAPLSEVPAIGRNPVYIYSLALFVVLQVPTALSTHIGMLIVFRFVTGVLGSPVLATGGASIAELYSPQKRALAIGIWGIAAVCVCRQLSLTDCCLRECLSILADRYLQVLGPVLGPLAGGFAAQAKGWRWTIWVLMWIAGLALAILSAFLPETSAKNILYRRAQRLRKLTGNDKLRTQAEIAFQHVTAGKIAQMTIIRPWVLTFTEPLIFLLHMWVALIFGLLFIWFESFPLVFIGIYHFNLGQNGLAFLGLLVGALLSILPFVWYTRSIQEKQFNERGQIIKPEMRLPPSMVGAICLPICLFWFGWSARPDIHWILCICGTGFYSIGALLVLVSREMRHAPQIPTITDRIITFSELGVELPSRCLSHRDGFGDGRQCFHPILLRGGIPSLCSGDVPYSGCRLGKYLVGFLGGAICTDTLCLLFCESLYPNEVRVRWKFNLTI